MIEDIYRYNSSKLKGNVYMADACVYLMETYSGDEFVNVGTGNDVSIGELAVIMVK
jgi:hypothetical protein